MNLMPLCELVEINPKVSLLKGQVYPFIEMELVTPGRKYVGSKNSRIYSGGGAKFKPGDTLLARITPCLENGKVAQFAAHSEGFGSTEFFVFRHRSGISDPGFVFYLISSDLIRKPAERSMSGASGRQRADIKAISGLQVPAPDLPTQRRIAAVLSAYDDLIENNARRIAILEEMARNLYREWFVEFRFPGYENVQMVDGVPEGWNKIELGKIAQEIRRGVNPEQIDPETPYVGLEHIPRRSITLSEWGTAREVQSTKLIFKKGEILFGKIRPYFHKVSVAPLDGVCSSDTIVIIPREEKQFSIVMTCVSSEAFVEHATRTSQGTKMPRANWDVLTKGL